jgi:serine protease AprX
MPRLARRLQLPLIVLLSLALLLTPRSSAAAPIIDPLLQQRLAAAPANATLSAILTYAQQPSATDLTSLLRTGAAIATFKHLPMVGVLATPAQLASIKLLPGLRSLYANQPLQYFLRESVPLIGASQVWADYGLKGEHIGVAVLDTGIDATHPDLQFGVKTVQNVKIVGLQYAAGVDLDQFNLPVKYVEGLPNTDTSGGHGTHVAGIIGASGAASDGYYQGVAPNVDLIGISAGEAIEIFSALAGFDWAIEHRAQYNIRVINCSWGNITPGFDPLNPVNIATKAAHDAGITVVFAAGNSGSTTDTLNTYSVAPWVISVAAGDKDGQSVSFFSSRGIPGDALYRPTLTAPGYLIVSDRASTGVATTVPNLPTDPVYIPPQHLARYTAASGSSMAAPHVAGAVALLVQARPELTPDLIKRVLVNTARPMPRFQPYAAGAGYLDVAAAVAEARQISDLDDYRDPQPSPDQAVDELTSRWSGRVGVSLPGLPASDTHTLEVAPGTVSLEIAVDWSTIASDLDLALYDPQGRLVATSATVQALYNYANETVHVDRPTAGGWTVTVKGLLNAPQDYRATSNALVLRNP